MSTESREGVQTQQAQTHTISYGKLSVPLYRAYATPLAGVTPIPESSFSGRSNTLFALEVDVEVLGDNFLPAYTQGDNTNVVATDSMKNFVLRQALVYAGATLEGFLALLGHGFLATYPQMQALRLTGRERPFVAARVPDGEGHAFIESPVLFSPSHGDYALASLDYGRVGDSTALTGHRCGRAKLQLIKVTGSAFTRFVRDEYTTLPERVDRPLFIYLDVYWRYADVADMLADTIPNGSSGALRTGPARYARYIPAEQVRDLVQAVFHEFVSESIQHLVHEIGTRLLDRFPQLAEVSFAAQNHTWDPVAGAHDHDAPEVADPRVKVYTDPFPAYGLITLTLRREAGNVNVEVSAST